VALGLIAGAVAGAGLIALWYLWGTAQNLGINYVVDYSLRPTTFVFTGALIVCLRASLSSAFRFGGYCTDCDGGTGWWRWSLALS
jgi:hypothetical protein